MEYHVLCPHCGCPLRFISVINIDDIEDSETLYETYCGKCSTCNKKYTWTKYYTVSSISPLKEEEDDEDC